MLETGVALTQVFVTTLAATAVGATLLGSRFRLHHAAFRLAARAAVGFLVISYAVFALALLGMASRAHLEVLFLLLGLVALPWLASWARHERTANGASSEGRPGIPAAPHGASRRATAAGRQAASWPRRIGATSPSAWLLAALAALYGIWTVLCAVLPASAPDELIHHLAVPRAMLESSGSVRFLDNIYAYFPGLGEMLFLLGLGVAGEAGARLFHAVFGCLVALALYGFSRRRLSAAASAWGVAVFLSVPSVMVILPWAYVDLIFTLYAFLAVALLVEHFASGGLRWAALSGLMAGGAFATKYTGLPLILLLVLLALVEQVRARRSRLPVAAVVLASVAVAVASPYPWRNWHLTGWPLFPFELGPFELRPEINWDPDRAALFLTMLASYGSSTLASPASLWDSLVAPVLVFVAARFDDPRWYDGVIGPVFLLTPALLWHRRARPGTGFLVLFALMSLVYWGLTIRQVRFLIPILPVLSFLLAAGLAGRRSRLVYGVVGLCVAASVAAGLGRVLGAGAGRFWTGATSRDAYLEQRIAGYAAYQAANRRLGRDDRLYLVNMRSFGYCLRPGWRGDFVFELYSLEEALGAAGGAGDLTGFFGSRGVTHLLIDEATTYSSGVLRPEQRAALQDFLTGRATLLERIDGRALYRLDGR